MNQELLVRWHSLSQSMGKEQLIALLQELVFRHPALLPEIMAMLEDEQDKEDQSDDIDTDEDWNFSGEGLPPSSGRSAPLPLDGALYRQRIEDYVSRLNQDDSRQAVTDDVTELLAEGEVRAEHQDYAGALEIYGLLLDERLRERDETLTLILDEALLAALSTLEIVLRDTGIVADLRQTPVSRVIPFSADIRQRWLERLFTLWLRCLDVPTMEKNLPRLMLDVARPEDLPFVQQLIGGELQRHAPSGPLNIVDFTYEYRIRALERFLKALP